MFDGYWVVGMFVILDKLVCDGVVVVVFVFLEVCVVIDWF